MRRGRGPALPTLGRTAGRILLAGIPVNFAWEMLQGPLFTGMPGSFWGATLLCALASVGDGFLFLVLYGLGALATRRVDWGRAPGRQGILLALTGGAGVAIGIEWAALWAGRWGYGPAMAMVPGLSVGLLPLPLSRWAAAPPSRAD